MSSLLASWLTSGVTISGLQRLLLALPLCLAVAIVYKTTRCDDVREIPLASLVLWVTIVLGMYSVGIAMWVVFRLMA